MTALWRDRLYGRLAARATPVIVMPTGVRSAASLWAGAREWTRYLREQGAGRGTRVACVHDDTAVVLQLLIACLWDGIDLWLCRAERIDAVGDWAHVQVGTAQLDGARGVWHVPLPGGWPDAQTALCHHERLSEAAPGPATVRTDDGIAVPHAQLLNDADTLADEWALTDARVLAVGAHHSLAGLMAGLLAPLLHAEELFVAQDDEQARTLLQQEPVTHLIATGEAADGSVVSWWQNGGYAARPDVRLHGCAAWPTR